MTQRSRKQARLLRWKVVLDTSVLIAAIGWRGDGLRVLDLLDYWRLWFSHPTKVTRVHSYARRFQASRDATDDKFIDAAVAGGVRYVITRDNDLLSLGEFQGIRFVAPQQFLAEFQRAEREK